MNTDPVSGTLDYCTQGEGQTHLFTVQQFLPCLYLYLSPCSYWNKSYATRSYIAQHHK